MCARRRIWKQNCFAIDQVLKNIADGDCRSSDVFWISLQCNFTGKKKTFYFSSFFCSVLWFNLPNLVLRVHARTQIHLEFFFSWNYFLYTHRHLVLEHLSQCCSRNTFLHLTDRLAAVTLLTAPRVCFALLENQIGSICTRAAVSNYAELWMNSRVFPDDNRDECDWSAIGLQPAVRALVTQTYLFKKTLNNTKQNK